MKLGISNIAWDIKNNNIIYSLMREKGVEGLEIAPTKFFSENPYLVEKDILKKLNQELEEENLKTMSMQSILFGQNSLVMFEDMETRKKMLDYLKKGVVFAKNLGVKNIVFGNPKNRISTSSNDWKTGIEFFRELGNFAEKNGVIIGIEANPEIYGGNFITTTESAIKFVLECDCKGICLNLDLGTMIENKEKLDVLNLIPIQKISHVHISEPYLELISKKNNELHKNLFIYLKKEGYKNYISIEMKYIEENNIENIEKCLEYISNLNIEVENE